MAATIIDEDHPTRSRLYIPSQPGSVERILKRSIPSLYAEPIRQSTQSQDDIGVIECSEGDVSSPLAMEPQPNPITPDLNNLIRVQLDNSSARATALSSILQDRMVKSISSYEDIVDDLKCNGLMANIDIPILKSTAIFDPDQLAVNDLIDIPSMMQANNRVVLERSMVPIYRNVVSNRSESTTNPTFSPVISNRRSSDDSKRTLIRPEHLHDESIEPVQRYLHDQAISSSSKRVAFADQNNSCDIELNRALIKRMRRKDHYLRTPVYPSLPTVKQCIIVCRPENVIFDDIHINHTYQSFVDLLNSSRISTRFRFKGPETSAFKLVIESRPKLVSGIGIIAPGMIQRILIIFTPDSLRDYRDELRVFSWASSRTRPALTIPLQARYHRPKLILPESIHIGSCLMYNELVMQFTITNIGAKASFIVNEVGKSNCHPFKISPTEFNIDSNEDILFTITFRPKFDSKEDVEFTARYVIKCISTIEDDREFFVHGLGTFVRLKLTTIGDAKVIGKLFSILRAIVFPDAIVAAPCAKSFTMMNESAVSLPYRWIVNNDQFAIDPDWGVFEALSSVEFMVHFCGITEGSIEAMANLTITDGVPMGSVQLMTGTADEVQEKEQQIDPLDYVDLRLIAINTARSIRITPTIINIAHDIVLGSSLSTMIRLQVFGAKATFQFDVHQCSVPLCIEPSSGVITPDDHDLQIQITMAADKLGDVRAVIICKIQEEAQANRIVMHGHVVSPCVQFLDALVDFGNLSASQHRCSRSIALHNPYHISIPFRITEHTDDGCDISSCSSSSLRFAPCSGMISSLSTVEVVAVFQPQRCGSYRSIIRCDRDCGWCGSFTYRHLVVMTSTIASITASGPLMEASRVLEPTDVDEGDARLCSKLDHDDNENTCSAPLSSKKLVRAVDDELHSDLTVPMLTVGAEIEVGMATSLVLVTDGDELHGGDYLGWFDSTTDSYRYGRLSTIYGQRIRARHDKGLSIEIKPTIIKIMDIIDVLRFRDEDAPTEYLRGKVLGQGAFGCVMEAINLQDGRRLAVKQIPMQNKGKASCDMAIFQLSDEIKVARMLSHENIVKFLGTRVDHDASCLYIFMELVSGGSLHDLIRDYGPLPESLVRSYTRQILLSLVYLHANGIVHRDIKGSNVLISNKGVVKLADFGAARLLQDACDGVLTPLGSRPTVCGTPSWMAPEVVTQEGYGATADIWSVGCTVIEMASGQRPWDSAMDQYQVLYALAQSDRTPSIPQTLSELGRQFCHYCLMRDPHLRPSADILLNHPWITESNDVDDVDDWA